MPDSATIFSQNRLRWACRRGMLELDLMLLPFAEQAYPTLAAADQNRFLRLLECPDPEILAWLMGEETPNDNDLKAIVALIRQHLSKLA